MSKTQLAALPFLAQLQEVASKVARRGTTIRFRMRRTGLENIPAIKELHELGIKVKVYTGRTITDLEKNTVRATPVLRHHTTVEVAF